jgi:hypothetical protein
VRLWYVNPATYGCSQAYDTRVSSDQAEIVKIIRFFSLEEHSAQLCGHWNIAAQTHIEIEGDEVTAPHTIRVKGELRPLAVRSGLFGSCTAVFADQEEPPLLLKVTWRPEHLRAHELRIARGTLGLGLPYAPEPIGLAKISTAGFQTRTSENFTTPATPVSVVKAGLKPLQRRGLGPRALSALVTRQPLADQIGKETSLPHLVHLHLQLAQQLLKFAKGGYHYRDLNEGNVCRLRGSADTLLLIDLGNMRRRLSPRGRPPGMTDAEAIIDRGIGDMQSANPLFLPLCYAQVDKAVKLWDAFATDLPNQLGKLTAKKTKKRLRRAIKTISKPLHKFSEILRKFAVYSHRYIDDLESALYLHFWRVSKLRFTIRLPDQSVT